jgi:serine protease AprX
VCTIKADAANRLFEISCRNITWAVIDSGIAATHPAFLDHDAEDRFSNPVAPKPTRVKAVFDFTQIELIRNFDLIAESAGSPERQATIDDIVRTLQALPGRKSSPEYRSIAARNLALIAMELEQRVSPDWRLIEPMIRLDSDEDGSHLVSDHGTHVAGILASDWRRDTPGPRGEPQIVHRGVCPDIFLYDLRVIGGNRRSTEFALLAALEFVQFVNARAANDGPVVHGVNVSMSILHDVRNYGCGSTPVFDPFVIG